VLSIEGGMSLDPSQTLMPHDWRNLPAFAMHAGDSLAFSLPEGGATLNPSKFHLTRSLWLDFGGGGATLSDQLNGQTVLRERIETQAPYALGRLELNGEAISITESINQLDTTSAATESFKSGFEAPPGSWNLEAISRQESVGLKWPIVGWNRDVESVGWTLHLPPGMALIHASGPDQVAGSFISSWTLWEIFLLCLLVLALAKVSGWKSALLAAGLFSMGLQEKGLAWPVWLNAILALALFRALPTGKLLQIARPYRWASVGLLAVVLIPYSIQQVRYALYPQLRHEMQTGSWGGQEYGFQKPAMEPEGDLGISAELAAEAALCILVGLCITWPSGCTSLSVSFCWWSSCSNRARAVISPRRSADRAARPRLARAPAPRS
jgi:hypothetical protein